MGKKWVELLYSNQGSQNSINRNPHIDVVEEYELLDQHPAFDPELSIKQATLLLQDSDYRILDTLERLNRQPDFSGLEETLKRLNVLIDKISIEMRLHILTEFNALLRTLSYSHSSDRRLFRKCLELVICFKKQLEDLLETRPARAKAEWIQIEKAIYYLTVWESQVDQALEPQSLPA